MAGSDRAAGSDAVRGARRTSSAGADCERRRISSSTAAIEPRQKYADAGRRPRRASARCSKYELVVMLAQACPARSASRCGRRSIRCCSGRAAATSSSARTSCCGTRTRFTSADNVVDRRQLPARRQGRVQPRHPDRRRRVHRPQHDSVVQERRHRHRRRREHRLQLRAVLGQPRHDRRQRADGRVQLRHRRRSRFLRSRRRPVLDQTRTSAGVAIGDGAWIGAGAKILDGVDDRRRAVIGAGAVVRDDVRPRRSPSACRPRVVHARREVCTLCASCASVQRSRVRRRALRSTARPESATAVKNELCELCGLRGCSMLRVQRAPMLAARVEYPMAYRSELESRLAKKTTKAIVDFR